MLKDKLTELVQKYNITTTKAVIAILLLLIIATRYFIQNNIWQTPINFLFGLYADVLMVNCKAFFYFINAEYVFDFINHQIIGTKESLDIDRFFFSINQIAAIFIICLITKSPIKSKIIWFLGGFLVITLYNSVRISGHLLLPETATVHNWFFNLLLIPRWLIVLIFAIFYWKRYPSIKNYIKKKFGFDEKFITSVYRKISVLLIIYQLLIIIAFNNFFIINGQLLIDLVLAISKKVLNILGYNSWIDERLIYGENASLFMDDACLGIGLMFLFAAFIIMLPGGLKHKLWYIPLGLTLIIILNCVRVILIFINISDNNTYSIPLEIHDLFTYPVLILTFFMWVVWINRFFIPVKNKDVEKNKN